MGAGPLRGMWSGQVCTLDQNGSWPCQPGAVAGPWEGLGAYRTEMTQGRGRAWGIFLGVPTLSRGRWGAQRGFKLGVTPLGEAAVRGPSRRGWGLGLPGPPLWGWQLRGMPSGSREPGQARPSSDVGAAECVPSAARAHLRGSPRVGEPQF